MASTHIVGVAVLMSQFFLFATDSMAGLSGQDSIIRAGLSSLDTTAGLFFSCAIANLVLDPEHGQKYSLNRWRRNHSKITDRTTFMKISLRVKWHELQMKKRVATLHLLSDPEKHLPPSAVRVFPPFRSPLFECIHLQSVEGALPCEQHSSKDEWYTA